jgi:hypothetical protein
VIVNQDIETLDLASNEIIKVIPPPVVVEELVKKHSIKGKPKFDLSINTEEESKLQEQAK